MKIPKIKILNDDDNERILDIVRAMDIQGPQDLPIVTISIDFSSEFVKDLVLSRGLGIGDKEVVNGYIVTNANIVKLTIEQ